MNRTYFKLFLISASLVLSGCLVSPVDDTSPLAGEWTTQAGLPMIFMETSAGCETSWDADAGIAVNKLDCSFVGSTNSVITWNYSFVGDVLFMQSIQIEIIDADGNNTTTDTSLVTVCGAFVPRDIAPDEATWKTEVNAVTWPSNCKEVLGITD